VNALPVHLHCRLFCTQKIKNDWRANKKRKHQPNGDFFKILFKIDFAEINPFIITKWFASQQLAIWCPAFQILVV
jgi:hypothetical protein